MMDACPSGEYASPFANEHNSLISKGILVGSEPFLCGKK